MKFCSEKLAVQCREFVRYNPENGELQIRRRNGDAGALRIDPRGYVIFKIGRATVLGHRAAWLLHHGAWPAGMLDHINRDRADNRIVNLREASRSANAQNAFPHSRTGFKGVSRKRTKYVAAIKVMGKSRWIGSFDDPRDAAAAYDMAALDAFGEHACTNGSLGLLTAGLIRA